MPTIPPTVPSRTVHISIADAPVGSRVQFVSPCLTDASGNILMPAALWETTLGVDGTATSGLMPCTDTATVTPLNWAYTVTLNVPGVPASGYLQLPAGSGALEFASAWVSSTSAPGGITTYATQASVAAEAVLRASGDTASAALVTAEAALRVSGDAAAVQLATVDAKGDLFVGTANDAVGRLPVGADTLRPVADSSQSTGWRFTDSIDLGFPANMIWCALGVTSAQVWATANAARYIRVIGSGTITKIAMDVSVQSGNICVAVYRRTGSGLSAKPGARVATSGSVACPAVGYAEVSLGGSIALYDGDYLAMSVDNTTASFRGLSGPSGVSGGMASGYSWDQGTAFPLPATATTGASGSASRIPLLIGVA